MVGSNTVVQHNKAGCGRKAALRPKCRKNTRHFCLAKALGTISPMQSIIDAAEKKNENKIAPIL